MSNKVTLLIRRYNWDHEEILGIYKDRKRALKILRYLFKRQELYHKAYCPNPFTSVTTFPHWANKLKNSFDTIIDNYCLETKKLK